MKKLLIVDDSSDLLDTMQKLFSFYDFTIRTAINSKTFIAEVESWRPQIVIVDVYLNGEDGRQICKAFREDPCNDDITLVIFSASTKRLQNFKEIGADGAIEKPFGIKDLIHTIETAELSRKTYLTAFANKKD